MPRRFFRKFALKRHDVGDRWFLAPFQHLLHDTRLWGTRRRTVVPAFALGLFIAFMPFPGHLAISALLALTIRVNIPVAVVASLVSNRRRAVIIGNTSVAGNHRLSAAAAAATAYHPQNRYKLTGSLSLRTLHVIKQPVSHALR